MNKGLILPVIFALTVFSLFSCQPDPVEPNPVPDALVGNFTVQVADRTATQANISWSVPSVPAGAALQYKVYIDGSLRSQNLTTTAYAVTDLTASATYNGRVVAYISPADSSVANFTIAPFVPGAVPDSIFVLSGVSSSTGLRLAMSYDESNGRIDSWSETYSSYNYDSTKVYYNAQGRVLSVVRKTPEGSYYLFNVKPSIYEYDAQGRVSKLYHKTSYSQNESYAYLTSLGSPAEVYSYDSMNYDAANRIKSIYSFYPHNGSAMIPGLYTEYKIYTYSATNDSLLSKMDSYAMAPTTNVFEQSTVTFNSFNEKAQPYYPIAKKLCLLGAYVHANVTKFTFLPSYFYGYSLSFDMAITPYLCTTLDYSPLTYSYNADGLVTQCYKAAASTDWVRFSYKKVRK